MFVLGRAKRAPHYHDCIVHVCVCLLVGLDWPLTIYFTKVKCLERVWSGTADCSNLLFTSVSYLNYSSTDRCEGMTEIKPGMHNGWRRPLWVKSLEWMIPMHSRDTAHDLGVKLSHCLCSCPRWQTLLAMPSLHAMTIYEACLISLVPRWSSIFLVVELPKIHVSSSLSHEP